MRNAGHGFKPDHPQRDGRSSRRHDRSARQGPRTAHRFSKDKPTGRRKGARGGTSFTAGNCSDISSSSASAVFLFFLNFLRKQEIPQHNARLSHVKMPARTRIKAFSENTLLENEAMKCGSQCNARVEMTWGYQPGQCRRFQDTVLCIGKHGGAVPGHTILFWSDKNGHSL